MGYYSYYELTDIQKVDKDLFGVNLIDIPVEEIEKIKKEMEEKIDAYFEYTKWYDYKEDIAKFSLLYPDYLFTISREGEESGDLEKDYILNGKVQSTYATIEYDKFDIDKLEEARKE